MKATATTRRSIPAALILVAVGAGCWVVTVNRMAGMDMGPGTELGGLGWYVGVWATMMAAMMLPSGLPVVLIFARISRDRERRGHGFVPTWVFLAGYLIAWVGYGLVAYGAYRVLRWAVGGSLDWD